MNATARLPVPASAPARFTAKAYLRMVEAGLFADRRIELWGGELREIAPAHSAHARIHARMVAHLHALTDPSGLGLAVDVLTVLGPDDIRGPDIALLHAGAPADGPLAATDLLLAIEIADSSIADDLGPKAMDYARAGIPHYWVVDIAARATHTMTGPGDRGYAERRVVPFDQPLPVPGTDDRITLA